MGSWAYNDSRDSIVDMRGKMIAWLLWSERVISHVSYVHACQQALADIVWADVGSCDGVFWTQVVDQD